MEASPIQQKQRLVIIDILRGWALLGVVLMNYTDYFYLGKFDYAKQDLFAKILLGIGNFVFSSKSWTMLSFLFGYGFAVLMENVAAKGINPVPFFARRMFWLFVIALVNSSFFFGDILKDYAVMGMVLLIFYRSSARTAFTISLVLLALIPAVSAAVNALNMPGGMKLLEPYFSWYGGSNLFNVLRFGLLGTYLYEIVAPGYLYTVHVIMLSCFFMGLAAQKTGFFLHLTDNKKQVKLILWGSLAAMVLLAVLFAVTNALKLTHVFDHYQPGYWFILASMVAIVCGTCWLYIDGKLKKVFYSLQVIGKMTLTNYLVQNLLGIFLFSGFGFGLGVGHKIHYVFYALFAVVIYLAQVRFSKWWLGRYEYGPVEWIWRQLSYGKRLELRKKAQ